MGAYKHRRGTSIPAILEPYEIAIKEDDNRLFFGKADGSPQIIETDQWGTNLTISVGSLEKSLLVSDPSVIFVTLGGTGKLNLPDPATCDGRKFEVWNIGSDSVNLSHAATSATLATLTPNETALCRNCLGQWRVKVI